VVVVDFNNASTFSSDQAQFQNVATFQGAALLKVAVSGTSSGSDSNSSGGEYD